MGKIPALCAANSSFQQDYSSCVQCVTANSVTNITLSIASEFQPFLSFCEAAQTETGTGGAAPTYLSAAKFSLLAQASSLGLSLVSTVQITQTSVFNDTVTVAPSPTSQFSLTTTSKPRLQIIVLYVATTSPNSSPTNTHSKTTNPTWIAGAVVGPLAVVALVALAFWLRMRKKRRNAAIANVQQPDEEQKEKDLMMKAQLHGDS